MTRSCHAAPEASKPYLIECRWSTAVLTASARKCKHAQHHWLQCNNALIMVMIVNAALLYQRLHLHHFSVLSNKV